MVLQSRAGAVLAKSRKALSLSSLAKSTAARFSTTTKVEEQSKPFEKVMVANRGEIAQRIFNTCKRMDIETVAIYTSADAKAPFVGHADEAVWIGTNYLDVPRVVDAIQSTGAQAVHPGYGFLSENAQFCNTISSMPGTTWLGPPVHAIQEMGDKVRSKQIATEANVTCIPGFEGEIESLEHALQVANETVGYPILLKAAAGGGGKGMRVCYNDQDLKDAYNLAKAESLKFFADDRLLVEKFIERPHHIEFQVLSAAPAGDTSGNADDLQVVVFPERECSIQRRNQKVIEETPSCLLTEETRAKMVEQVQQLVRSVGYTSAGTVEWLVDEEQNFYFLEMNTRLQVEHPITEAISQNIDLVEGMLYCGAGWGLPPSLKEILVETPSKNTFRVMAHGHAIEARIYAEDPLRGFLPSTGPLVPYIEPVSEDDSAVLPSMDDPKTKFGLRLDSGVVQGHVVTPHYDPMLSKIIYSAPTRELAIDGLAHALDRYVIQGVQHNTKLVNAVLRHDSFKAGDTPTSFLPTHYPDGFQGAPLTPAMKKEWAVAGALIMLSRQCQIVQLPPFTPGADEDGNMTAVVRLGGQFGEAYLVTVHPGLTTATVQAVDTDEDTTPVTIQIDEPINYQPEKYLALATLDGVPRYLQVLAEKSSGEVNMQMYGADLDILVQSPREYELSKHMHEPVPPDYSDMVLTPMPGALISYAVKEGDHVEDGQELCVVEAMKMQNIIRSPRAGTIAKCRVPVGSSLKADQIILEFEPEDVAAEAAQ